MEIIQKTMVEEFQCPGCATGVNTEGGCYNYEDDSDFACKQHAAGTMMPGIGLVNLGLPKGFNYLGPIDTSKQSNNIRLFDGTLPRYNECNVPVWAMEKDGYLIVRCYMPRINYTCVDVIRNGKLSQLPSSVMDVSKFIDQID